MTFKERTNFIFCCVASRTCKLVFPEPFLEYGHQCVSLEFLCRSRMLPKKYQGVLQYNDVAKKIGVKKLALILTLHFLQNLLAQLPRWCSNSEERGLSANTAMTGHFTKISLSAWASYIILPSSSSEII